MTKPLTGRRVVDPAGHAGTITAVEGEVAQVLFDYQRPSSDPKSVPVAQLTVLRDDPSRR